MSNNEIQKSNTQLAKPQTHLIQWLISDNPNRLLEIADIETSLTITKCLDGSSISTLIRSEQFSKKNILRSIQNIILTTAKTFKYSEKMDLEQSFILTSDIFDYFKNESIEDIALMFKMIRKGELGSGKGRLDSDTLFNLFIPNYMQLKAEQREKNYANEKAQFNKRVEGRTEESQAKFEELYAKLGNANKIPQEEIVPVVNHHVIWLENLPKSVKLMKIEDLKNDLLKAEKSTSVIFQKAVEIYKGEIKSRESGK